MSHRTAAAPGDQPVQGDRVPPAGTARSFLSHEQRAADPGVSLQAQSAPFEYIGGLLTGAGYVVLVSERRGYGRSDGLSWPEDVGKSRGRLVARLEEETDDVLAAVDQAGGALTWNGNPAVRAALTIAAEKSTTPTLLLVADNDRTTESITTVGEILKKPTCSSSSAAI